MPGNLPFQLEPYRLIVALVLAGWVAALLVDPRVRWRGSGLEAPLLAFAAAALASVLVNWARVRSLDVEPNTLKSLTFLVSFLLVVFLIASLVRSIRDLDFLIKALVVCGTVLGAFALFEAVSGYNIFDHLAGTLPFLRSEPLPFSLRDSLANDRGGRLRVYASAQDPIALSALLVMLVPLAAYLASFDRRRMLWWGCGGVLTLGAIAPLSRTGIVMLIVVAAVFLWLRPRQTRRLWPALLPVFLVIHLILPGSIGALESAFLPAGGIIAQQQAGAGTGGSGRLADVGPSLAEWSRAPLLGEGYGTRIVDGPTPNAPILDDELAGLRSRPASSGSRHGSGSRAHPGAAGGRCAGRPIAPRAPVTALTASIASYAVGMFTYDSFSFIQVTLVLFFLSGSVPRRSPSMPACEHRCGRRERDCLGVRPVRGLPPGAAVRLLPRSLPARRRGAGDATGWLRRQDGDGSAIHWLTGPDPAIRRSTPSPASPSTAPSRATPRSRRSSPIWAGSGAPPSRSSTRRASGSRPSGATVPAASCCRSIPPS